MGNEAEYIFIVARDRLDLYAYLRRTFSGDNRIRVILDQRVGERRQPSGGSESDRRRADRRAEANVAAHLPTLGFAIIRLTY
jgi:hypothetical protein